jgi:hypothetical protein
VSCAAASFCVAVGSVIDKWNGHGWTELKAPKGTAGDVLHGVVCRRSTFCMAVGTDSGVEANVAEAWNGRAWRTLTTPQNGCGPFCGLAKVACPSISDCIAVGGTESDSDLSDFSEGMAWNGTRWRSTPTPRPGGNSSLSGVSCTGTSSCVAVGNFGTENPPCNCILAATWNGSAWQQISTPPTTGDLTSVSCTAAHACVAAGGDLALSWNGSAWKQLTIAMPGETGTSLSDLTCWRASACMAVGSYTEASGARLTLAEKWSGGAWNVARTRSPADPFSGLSGVSCTLPARCVAVGTRIGASDGYQTLAESWNGTSWRTLATPNPSAEVSELLAVSCPAVGHCVAVGYYDSAGSPQNLAEELTGSGWHVLATSQSGTLTGISCLTTSDCVATGSVFGAKGQRLALAEGWNGSTWSMLPAVSPGATISQLSGVSCPTSSICRAAGSFNSDLTSPLHPLTEVRNGSTWTVQSNPGGSRQLASISCLPSDRCMAVGSNLATRGPHVPSGTAGMVLNGSAWKVTRTASPSGGLRAHLGGVSCSLGMHCMAVGGYVTASGRVIAITETWNTSRWRLRAITTPSPAFGELYGVSCPNMKRCIAVGATGAQQTLAEQWNGSRWTLLKTLNP